MHCISLVVSFLELLFIFYLLEDFCGSFDDPPPTKTSQNLVQQFESGWLQPPTLKPNLDKHFIQLHCVLFEQKLL